jgi:hypothetical protein
MSCGLVPVACATTLILTVLRRRLNQHETRTTRAVSRLLEQHEVREEELAAREHQLIKAERLFARKSEMESLRIRSAWKRADLLADENSRLRERCRDLERDLEEVSTEFNELVGETLRQRNTVFTHRTTGTATIVQGGDDEHSRPLAEPTGPTARPGRPGAEVTSRSRERAVIDLIGQRDRRPVRGHESR